MRKLYEQRSRSADRLDQKAGTILGSTTLVLSLVATLQLALLGANQPVIYWIGLAVAFILYIVIITVTIWAIAPTTYETPIKADWAVLDQRVFRVSEHEALLTLIKAYKDRNNATEGILRRKAHKVRLAGWLLASIVTILMLLSLIAARGSGTPG